MKERATATEGPMNETTKQVAPRVDGARFYCDCGCNVFRRLSPVRIRCNACQAIWEHDPVANTEREGPMPDSWVCPMCEEVTVGDVCAGGEPFEHPPVYRPGPIAPTAQIIDLMAVLRGSILRSKAEGGTDG